MSARPPKYRTVAVVTLLLAAAVAPSLGTGSAAATAASSASFEKTVVYEQRGDVANITIQTSQAATVNLGSAEDSFWMQLQVGKGTTRLRLNTYKAGESTKYPLSEMVWASKGSIQSRTLRTAPIDAPLDTAEYQMNVTIQGQERALGTFVVKERSTNGVTARIAPRQVSMTERNSKAALQEVSVPPWNESVAHDDWLLLHVNATGVRGALKRPRLDGDGEAALRVDFAQTNPPMNGDGNEFTGASVERLVTGNDHEGFYLVVDTGDEGIEPGDRYRVSFVVPAKSPLAEKRENVSTEFRVAERRVNVARNGPGEKVIVEDETAITGKTTLTPGTTINISARDTGTPPFLYPRTVTVGKDRTFQTTFDFSELEPGRNFEIRLVDQKRTIPAMVAKKETTTPPPTTTTAAITTTTTVTTTATTTTTTAEGLTQAAMRGTERPLSQQAEKGSADEEDNGGLVPVPGFGASAGVVAALAAALLATRRS
ncbi:BGTF surface domain-containing protein [Halorussus sp. MSC15.2]|uniref:BGTF surface domain-containing protein n=1 Tax=Halorussus sp. MSC15.2 TaxID=2283638 RepID=UPI0013D0CCC8|nr:BGTF surface domain-containing protein [Halorussus sp. MSC15.2]NEU55822.1 PGF-CTERM sorting domain-containing protein [Halorussus sp. MSC15.2]